MNANSMSRARERMFWGRVVTTASRVVKKIACSRRPGGQDQTCPVLASSAGALAPRPRAPAPPRAGFFLKVTLLEEAPHRAAAARNLVPVHRQNRLVQGQVWPSRNQTQ